MNLANQGTTGEDIKVIVEEISFEGNGNLVPLDINLLPEEG